MREIKLPFPVRFASVLLCVVLIGGLMMKAQDILIPLVFATLGAFLLLPMVSWLERRKVPKSLAILLCVLLLIGVMGSFVYFLSMQLVSFSEMFPVIEKQLQQNMAQLQGWIAQKYHINGTQQMGYLNKASGSILNTLSGFVQMLLVLFSGAAFSVVFVFIYIYFILYYRRTLALFIMRAFAEEHHTKVGEIISESRGVIYSYIFGLLIEMTVVATVNCIALSLFHVQYFMLIGLVAAVLNVIPYIGFFVSIGIAFIITVSNSTVGHAIEAAVIMWVIHLVDANILMPRIVGARVKMNALITIVAVLVGNLVWGVAGMFLFIPLVAIAKIIFERIDGLKAWAILIGDSEKPEKTSLKQDATQPVEHEDPV
jgi:predicted PurR-regulated permease PerM